MYSWSISKAENNLLNVASTNRPNTKYPNQGAIIIKNFQVQNTYQKTTKIAKMPIIELRIILF